MNQIKSIQLGVIAICIATIPLSLAQTPRTRTSGSNQIITTTTAAPRYSGSSGNVTRPAQIGINAGSDTNIGATTNAGAHTATNPGVQTGISNHAIGIIRAATAKSGSTGNSTMAAEAGTNAATGTNTTANRKSGVQTGTASDAYRHHIVEPGSTPGLILFTATPTPREYHPPRSAQVHPRPRHHKSRIALPIASSRRWNASPRNS
jgi:hypothetical protein